MANNTEGDRPSNKASFRGHFSPISSETRGQVVDLGQSAFRLNDEARDKATRPETIAKRFPFDRKYHVDGE